MRHRIDDSLLPGKGGILDALSEEEIYQWLALIHAGLHCPIGFLDKTQQRSLDASALDNVELRADLVAGQPAIAYVRQLFEVPIAGIANAARVGGQVVLVRPSPGHQPAERCQSAQRYRDGAARAR